MFTQIYDPRKRERDTGKTGSYKGVFLVPPYCEVVQMDNHALVTPAIASSPPPTISFKSITYLGIKYNLNEFGEFYNLPFLFCNSQPSRLHSFASLEISDPISSPKSSNRPCHVSSLLPLMVKGLFPRGSFKVAYAG